MRSKQWRSSDKYGEAKPCSDCHLDILTQHSRCDRLTNTTIIDSNRTHLMHPAKTHRCMRVKSRNHGVTDGIFISTTKSATSMTDATTSTKLADMRTDTEDGTLDNNDSSASTQLNAYTHTRVKGTLWCTHIRICEGDIMMHTHMHMWRLHYDAHTHRQPPTHQQSPTGHTDNLQLDTPTTSNWTHQQHRQSPTGHTDNLQLDTPTISNWTHRQPPTGHTDNLQLDTPTTSNWQRWSYTDTAYMTLISIFSTITETESVIKQEAKGIWQRLHRMTPCTRHAAYSAGAPADLSCVTDRQTDWQTPQASIIIVSISSIR